MTALNVGTYVKSPTATKDYPIDWQPYLGPSEKVVSATYSVSPAGLTVGSGAYASTIDADGKGTVVWLSGGTAGTSYVVTCHVTTNNVPPRIDDRTITINMDEAAAGGGVTSTVGDILSWDGASYVPRRHAIRPDIDPTGAVDGTAAIQAALNSRSGAWVELPWGTPLIAGNITVPAACSLTGQSFGHRAGPLTFSPPQSSAGTMVLATSTTGDLFTLRQNATIEGVGVHYPNQVTNATPTVYGWTFQIANGAHYSSILNCYATNPYKLIQVGIPGGAVGGARIDTIMSWPLFRGIVLGRVADVPRVSNVHFNPAVKDSNNTAAVLKAWVAANGVAIIVDGAESYDFTDCFAISYAIGFWSADFDADGFLGVSGNWKGGSFDDCGQCVVLDNPRVAVAAGLKFYGVNFAVAPGGIGINCNDTSVPSSSYYRPVVSLMDCAIGGGAQYNTALNCVAGSYGVIEMIGGLVQNFTAFGAATAGANAKIVMERVRRWTALLGGSAMTNGGAGIVDSNALTV